MICRLICDGLQILGLLLVSIHRIYRKDSPTLLHISGATKTGVVTTVAKGLPLQLSYRNPLLSFLLQ